MEILMENFVNMGPTILFAGSMWVALIAFILCVLLFWLSYYLDNHYGEGDGAGLVAVVLSFLSLITLILGAFSAFPYTDAKYYSVMRVEGHVTSVSNVFSDGSSDGVTRVPVVTLDTVPDFAMIVEDPRAVDLLNKNVTLSCEFSWNYQAIDGVSCKIYKIGK
jgi:hypothetical protein